MTIRTARGATGLETCLKPAFRDNPCRLYINIAADGVADDKNNGKPHQAKDDLFYHGMPFLTGSTFLNYEMKSVALSGQSLPCGSVLQSD
jgi:hypothetical protein